MNKAEELIRERLEVRAENGSLRQLSHNTSLTDFCSNDYLGFARSNQLSTAIEQTLAQSADHRNGATGSRLISGNHSFTESTEAFIAEFHNAESALIFNSGYDANIGLISSLARRGDTVILDELIHASLIDGARLTHANRYTFKHNDVLDLESKLKAAKGTVYVLVESVYSMEGDIAPLPDICRLCEHYQANLIVDEAHAVGIFGKYGKGLVQDLKLENKIFARVVTFGKALGCHGAVVLGSTLLRSYLINFARSFIYTTAAPLHSIVAIKCAYQLLSELDYPVLIHKKIELYRSLIMQSEKGVRLLSPSTIQTVRYNNNSAAKSAAIALQQNGMNVRAILSPSVPVGEERLRICLHLFNTDEEIKSLVAELKKLESTS